MTLVAGRLAFITGAANGIGLGIARALAKAGAKLALADIDEIALTAAASELSKLTDVETFVLDVRDRPSFETVANSIEKRLGAVTLLVNNAGVAGGAPAAKLTYELWDWGMGINLNGVINGIQTFLPRMARLGQGGHIVNTASIAGLVANPRNGVLYTTAKYAVVGMSESLAHELEPSGIGVTVLCPGPVATGIIDRTRKSQPRYTKSISDEQRVTVFKRNETMYSLLQAGTLPDKVGEMVLRAIEHNELFVLTDHRSATIFNERAERVLRAIPIDDSSNSTAQDDNCQ